MPRSRKYPEELIQRGVRLALESGRPITRVARDIGLPSETLRKRVRQAEDDGGLRPDRCSLVGRWGGLGVAAGAGAVDRERRAGDEAGVV
ncbi:MAG: transposase [Solirubrobacteraceae bacterium]